MFLRSKQFLAGLIPRVQIKAEKGRKKDTMDHPCYPDFEAMPHLPPSSSPSPSIECPILPPWKATVATTSTTTNLAVMSMLQQQQEQEQQWLSRAFLPLSHRQQSRNTLIDDQGSFRNLLLHSGHITYQTPLQCILTEAATVVSKMNETIELRDTLLSLLLQSQSMGNCTSSCDQRRVPSHLDF